MFFTKDPNRLIRDKGHLGYIISAMMFAGDALGSEAKYYLFTRL